MSATARRNGLSASQLFNWRRLAREGRLGEAAAATRFAAAFVAYEGSLSSAVSLPEQLKAPETPACSARAEVVPGRIEIVLNCGHRVVVDQGVDATLASGWPLKRVEALIRAILRAAYYELRSRPDVPAKVVLREYVDIAAAFYGPEESGMINAVLDALARQSRPNELSASPGCGIPR